MLQKTGELKNVLYYKEEHVRPSYSQIIPFPFYGFFYRVAYSKYPRSYFISTERHEKRELRIRFYHYGNNLI